MAFKKSKLFISEPGQKEFRSTVKTITGNIFVAPMNSPKNKKPVEIVIFDLNNNIPKNPHCLTDLENLKTRLMKSLKDSCVSFMHRNNLINKISIDSFEFTIRNKERQDVAVVLMI